MKSFSIENSEGGMTSQRETMQSILSDGNSHMTASPLDQARITAPFVIGTSIRQLVECKHIGSDGTCTTEKITKQDFARAVGLNIRDLRILDKSPPNRKEAAVNVRNNLIILSIEGIKAVIGCNEIIIFCPEDAIAQKFLPFLQHQIETEGDIQGNRFEHVVLEAILSCACSAINDEFIDLVNRLNLEELVKLAQDATEEEGTNAPRAKITIRKALKSNVVKDMIRRSEMTPLKTKLSKLRKRVLEILRVLNEILDDDDLFRGLFLPIEQLKNLRKSLSLKVPTTASDGNGASVGTAIDAPASSRGEMSQQGQEREQKGSFPDVVNPMLSSSFGHLNSSATAPQPANNIIVPPASVLANNPRSRRRASMLGGNILNGTMGLLGGSSNAITSNGMRRGSSNGTQMFTGTDDVASHVNTSSSSSSAAAICTANEVKDEGDIKYFQSESAKSTTAPPAALATAAAMAAAFSMNGAMDNSNEVTAEQINNCESILDSFIAQFSWIASEIEDTHEQIISAESK